MDLSVIIGTHNEAEYIPTLLKSLVSWKTLVPFTYEIVIVDDHSDDPVVLQTFNTYCADITVHTHAVDADYGRHKSFMNTTATAPWILNLDADELVGFELFSNILTIIEGNPTIQAYALPRINIVDDLPLWYVTQWRCGISSLPEITSVHKKPVDPQEYALWAAFNLIDEETDDEVIIRDPLVAWPDYQWRLYKNDPTITWSRPVHEILTGFTAGAPLPAESEYAILHQKPFNRQVAQNNKYAQFLGQ